MDQRLSFSFVQVNNAAQQRFGTYKYYLKNDVVVSAGRKVFRDFLRGEYSEENIMFWLACEELKRETDPDAVEEKARFIYEDYISILSPKEVPFYCSDLLLDSLKCIPTPAPNRPFVTAGVLGLARTRSGEPQHGGADAPHLRRGAVADLHVDASRLVPALRQLAAVQDAGATHQRFAERRGRTSRRCAGRPQRAVSAHHRDHSDSRQRQHGQSRRTQLRAGTSRLLRQ